MAEHPTRMLRKSGRQQQHRQAPRTQEQKSRAKAKVKVKVKSKSKAGVDDWAMRPPRKASRPPPPPCRRTPVHHVSAVLAKLDVPTRKAAASQAARLGLAGLADIQGG